MTPTEYDKLLCRPCWRKRVRSLNLKNAELMRELDREEAAEKRETKP